LEGVLQERQSDFRGILNGLDTDVWNPSKDVLIKEKYSKASTAGRVLCKADLQRSVGLPVNPDVPLLGFIARLDYQKGVDIVIESARSWLTQGVQLVSLGQGNQEYLAGFKRLVSEYPRHMAHESAFAEHLAHKIYAGADLFLMPSRYEPCGLSQMIAMRYGSVPVVTPTGGLLDTVEGEPSGNSTGFVAKGFDPASFSESVRQALKMLKNKNAWKLIQKRGMSKDFSWKTSVKKYVTFYKDLQKRKVAR
jgi:starch synthase